MKLKLALTLVAVLSMATLTSCFTGIESTPKITAADVKKQNIVITPEQRFIADVGVIPFSQWHDGKRFFVTDDKIALAFGASAHGVDSLKGQLLTYRGYDAVPGVAGVDATVLNFDTDGGTRLQYRIEAPIEVVKSRESVSIPFAIDLDVVALVHQLLATKQAYILTSSWFNDEGRSKSGRKFVPVIIENVLPGNSVYPLLVNFVDARGEKGAVYMSLGASKQATRNFDTLFSFTDPRQAYPHISDETWENIKQGRVEVDMTREECRLALGSPKEIDRRPGYGGVAERWTYVDGVYLIFEDGLLRDFRR